MQGSEQEETESLTNHFKMSTYNFKREETAVYLLSGQSFKKIT